MLDCPINLETHKFLIDGNKFVFDVSSLSYFVIDKITNDILDLSDSYLTEHIIEKLNHKYKKDKIKERLNQLESFWEQGKINTYNQLSYFPDKSDPIYTISINLAGEKCNLNCEYCYKNDDSGKKGIDIETAKDGIDFVVENMGSEAQKYVIDLSGSSEPLLRMNLIKKLINIVKK